VPIVGARSVKTIQKLCDIAFDQFETGPGPLSTSVFWRRSDGGFERVGENVGGGVYAEVPTPAFQALCQRIAAS